MLLVERDNSIVNARRDNILWLEETHRIGEILHHLGWLKHLKPYPMG
jgi:hypothetical protein